MRVGIHQPNFIPWFPYFYKMAMCDVFVIMAHCQYEKNGFQNRAYVKEWDKWLTKPIRGGLEPIIDKKYVDDRTLVRVNLFWILAIKETLGIDTRVVFDFPTEKTGTARILEILNVVGAKTYVTNEEAKNKYLAEEALKASQIDIEYCKPPVECQKHIFEMFKDYGIEGTRLRLPKSPKKKAEESSRKETPEANPTGGEEEKTTAEELFGEEEANDYKYEEGKTNAKPQKEIDAEAKRPKKKVARAKS